VLNQQFIFYTFLRITSEQDEIEYFYCQYPLTDTRHEISD
jgi:hypothetical protein